MIDIPYTHPVPVLKQTYKTEKLLTRVQQERILFLVFGNTSSAILLFWKETCYQVKEEVRSQRRYWNLIGLVQCLCETNSATQ